MPRPTTITKFLRYEFTPEELQAKGKELAEQHDKRARLEEEFEAVKAQFKERTATIERDSGKLSRQITSGFEMRDIECACQWNIPVNGRVRIARKDTGEVVEERDMTSIERQEELPLNANVVATVTTKQRRAAAND
jgi:hypothetical protein